MNMARNRAENFSAEEKAYLVEIVHGRRNIIENKRVDAVTVKQKNDAWAAIVLQMKNHFPDKPERTVKQLKDLWRREKIKAKNEASSSKQSQRATGGGSADALLSSQSRAVIDTIGDDAVEPSPNPYDDDADPDTNDANESDHQVLYHSLPHLLFMKYFDTTQLQSCDSLQHMHCMSLA